MADLHIKRSGAWTPIANCKIKRSSAWTQVVKVWIKRSGAWSTVWQNLVIALNSTTPIITSDTSGNGYRALVGLKVVSDGELQDAAGSEAAPLTFGFRENWGTPNSAGLGSGYHFKLDIDSTSGAAGTMSGTTGSWLSASSDITWTWVKNTDTNGTSTANVTLSVSDDGGSTTLDSVSFAMTATEEP